MKAVMPASTERLATHIEREIERKTWGRVHQLRIEVQPDGVRVQGYTSSYYLKQLAIQAVVEALADQPNLPIRMDVLVGTGAPR